VALGLLILAACRSPQPAPAPPPKAPVQAGPQGQAGASAPARPQFTFAGWSRIRALVQSGQVIATVSGRGGFAVILQDRTWVRLIAKPDDPMPRNPVDLVNRLAPNARDIRHSTE
jgi:hypothetical protein